MDSTVYDLVLAALNNAAEDGNNAELDTLTDDELTDDLMNSHSDLEDKPRNEVFKAVALIRSGIAPVKQT